MRLIISLNANDFRIHLSGHTFENPEMPTPFCMFLRKHLTGAVLNDVLQTGMERIVFIPLTARNDFGEVRQLKLIVELMGKYSNFIVTDEQNKVLSCLKHVTFDISRVRQMLPSIPYELPPIGEDQPAEA